MIPDASEAMVQLKLPVPPTTGLEQVHPPGAAKDTKVVLAGVAPVKDTLLAEAGPLLVSVCT